MNEDPSQPPPVPRSKAGQKILWLIVALLPSLLGVITVSAANTNSGVLSFLVILNLVCSIAASIGLVRDINGQGLRYLVAFLLVPAFFVMNAFIVVFIGCTIAMRGV